jgi:hypothetical protein
VQPGSGRGLHTLGTGAPKGTDNNLSSSKQAIGWRWSSWAAPPKAMDEREALVNFISALIQRPSVNGQDGERAVIERVCQEALALGLEVEQVALQADRPNAVRCFLP